MSRKLLSQDKEIITQQCLTAAFTQAYKSIIADCNALSAELTEVLKLFVSQHYEVDNECLERLKKHNAINGNNTIRFQPTVVIADPDITTKTKAAVKACYQTVDTSLSTIKNNSKLPCMLKVSVGSDACWVSPDTQDTWQIHGQSSSVIVYVTVCLFDTIAGLSFTSLQDLNKAIDNGMAQHIPEETKLRLRKAEEMFTALARRIQQMLSDMVTVYNALTSQLKAIHTADALKELLPAAYQYLPVETIASTKTALISQSTLVNLNQLIKQGWKP